MTENGSKWTAQALALFRQNKDSDCCDLSKRRNKGQDLSLGQAAAPAQALRVVFARVEHAESTHRPRQCREGRAAPGHRSRNFLLQKSQKLLLFLLCCSWVVFEEPAFCGESYILERGLYGCPEDWGALQPRIASAMPVVLVRAESCYPPPVSQIVLWYIQK